MACNRISTHFPAPENREVSNGFMPSVAHRGRDLQGATVVAINFQYKTVNKYGTSKGIRPRRPAIDRFFEKVNKNGPTPNHKPEIGNCWEWIGAVNATGYGVFCANHQVYLAHRFSLLSTSDAPQDKPCVCHHCDNPSCVRPSHLFFGTKSENNTDRNLKGRTVAPRGSNHNMAKLTEEDVIYIRANYVRRKSRPLLDRFGITKTTLSYIIKRKIWKHV